MKRERWIDITKCIAIIAVLVDHLYTRAYHSEIILKSTYLSVGLFVLTQGFSTYLSYKESKVPLYKKVFVRILEIFIPYVLATFICLVVLYKKFDIRQFIFSIVNFNATGPYYYVCLYIQLVLVSPVIFIIIKRINMTKYPGITKIMFMIGILIISYLTSTYTQINESYGGGSKLLGGSYLILLCIGMFFGDSYSKIRKIEKTASTKQIIICLIIAAGNLYYICKYGFNYLNIDIFGSGLNPPGLPIIIYAVAVFAAIVLISVRCNDIIQCSKLIDIMCYVGKHTLYIFLYHEIVLIIVDSYICNMNIWIKRVGYMSIMLAVPLVLDNIIAIIRRNQKLLYKSI